DDTRAGGLGELDRCRADTAGTAVHKDHLTRLQIGAPMQAEPSRLIVDEERCGLHEGHGVWNFQHAVQVCMRDLGVTTAVQTVLRDHGEHAVSGPEAAAAWSSLDLAGHLGA